MLMNFKNCAEDEECPIPDDVRESMLTFHTALLGHCGKCSETASRLQHKHLYGCFMKASLPGVHIEEEEQEEEVDNSVRGRLLRLLERVKKFREKRVEEEPEPQEDTKPSELVQIPHTCQYSYLQFLADTFVWIK